MVCVLLKDYFLHIDLMLGNILLPKHTRLVLLGKNRKTIKLPKQPLHKDFKLMIELIYSLKTYDSS